MTSDAERPAAAPFHPVAHSLQAVINLSNEIERELVRVLGINLTDYRALTTLIASGPVTVSELAHRIGVTAATTTAIVNRLEFVSYVRRERVDADRRRVHVSVTPAVQPLIMQLLGPLMRDVDGEIASLPAEQQGIVEAFFGRVTTLLGESLEELASREPLESAPIPTNPEPTTDGH